MHNLSEKRTETEKCTEEQAQRVTGIAVTENAAPSQRVKGIAGNAILGERLALAKASQKEHIVPFKKRRQQLGLRDRLEIARIRRLPRSINKEMLAHYRPMGRMLKGVENDPAKLGDPTRSDGIIAEPYMEPKGVEKLIDQWMADEKDITAPGTDVNMTREDIGRAQPGTSGAECMNKVQSTEEPAPRSRTERWARWCYGKLKTLRIPSALLDSGATSTFGRVQDGMIPTGEKSGKQVGMPDGREARATEKAKLPMTQLRKGAKKGDILPALADNTLVSVSAFANNDCYNFLARVQRSQNLRHGGSQD